MSQVVTRRSFLGGATLGAVALTMGGIVGCSPKDTGAATDASNTWDKEVDLLICGCGGAGMACAVEAKDNGVEKVLIIEKNATIGGTTTTSQGMIAGYDTQLQKKQEIQLTYDQMYENLMNNASYRLDPMLTKITVENSGKTIDWLIDRVKVDFTDDIKIFYGPLPMMHIVKEGGAGFASAFSARLDELGVDVEKNTKLVDILLDANGAVEGALIEVKGKAQRVKAKTVMLATGGYANNPTLTALLDPEKTGTFGIGFPTAEGDGLVAASKAGALLSHTNDMMCVLKDYTIMKDHSGTSASANVNGFTNLKNMVLIGANGKRFFNEGNMGYMSQNLNSPIFDQLHRDGTGYVWQLSDEAAIAGTAGKTKRGENLPYVTGADVAQVAAAMGVDPAGLAETIEKYNAAVDAGFDAEFGRVPTVKLTAPFVALPVVPCEIITYGGVARSEKGEVIKADTTPIPGLYIGGEVSCNSAYMGFTLSNCFTWGRISGKNAATYLSENTTK